MAKLSGPRLAGDQPYPGLSYERVYVVQVLAALIRRSNSALESVDCTAEEVFTALHPSSPLRCLVHRPRLCSTTGRLHELQDERDTSPDTEGY